MVGKRAKMGSKWSTLGIALVTMLIVGAMEYAVLGSGVSSAKPAEADAPSSCVADLKKSVDPEMLALGGSVDASLVVSMTCGAKRLPIDLVIVADESYSMTRAQGGIDSGGRTPPATVDPMETVLPGRTPGGGGISTPGGSNGGEPAFCAVADGNINPPTPTRTPRFPRRPTPTVDHSAPEPLEPAGSEDLVREEKNWIRDFLDRDEIKRDLASDRLRMAFVSFAGKVQTKTGLTSDASDTSSGASRMRGYDLSNIKAGLSEAGRILNSSSSRSELGDSGRVTIVILLSDFQFCLKDMRGIGLDKATTVITVGFGRSFTRKNAADMATDRSTALESKDLKEVIHLYEDVLGPPKPVQLVQLKASDHLNDNMLLDPTSVDPMTATITGQLIEWQLPVATLPQTLTYRVAPQDPGTFSLSESAGIEWTDSDGLLGSAPFPDAIVEVVPQTATPTPTATDTPTDTPTTPPTATATSTATATRVPEDLYLPVTYRNWPECIPEEQTIDVVLVIDTSISMQDPTTAGGQPKIAAAITAGTEIVTLLKPTDQAAVVGFNSTSTLASQLTSDKAALSAALQSLPGTMAAGTLIDTGLQAGTEELLSPRHLSANKRSIILVTDGAQSNGDTGPVLTWAATAKTAGITVITVGLGTDIDEALLRQVASAPALYFAVPDAVELLRIYREVARIIPCP